MKKKILYSSLLLCLLLTGFLSCRAQMVIKIIPPELNALIDSNNCHMQMINLGEDQLNFILSINLKLDTNGYIYRANSHPMTLLPLESKSLSWDTIALPNRDLSGNGFPLYDPKQILPGLYNLCLEAIEIKNRKEIGKDCLQINVED